MFKFITQTIRIGFLVLMSFISCNSDKKGDASDPKIQALSKGANKTTEELEIQIHDLQNVIAALKADTIEAHRLLQNYDLLKSDYLNLQTKLSSINTKSRFFEQEFNDLKIESQKLKERYDYLYSKNIEFKVLANENKAIHKQYIGEIEALKNKSNGQQVQNRIVIENLRHELSFRIDSLRTILMLVKDSLRQSNSDNSNANQRIVFLENKLSATTNELNLIEKKLNDLPDTEPILLGVEIRPHRAKKSVKVKNGTSYPKGIIDTVRVNLQLKKIKDDAKPKTLYVQYIITASNKEKAQSITFNKKLITIQNKPIQISDSIVLKPTEVNHIDFKIHDFKLPPSAHTIKIYYSNCNLDDVQCFKFTTY